MEFFLFLNQNTQELVNLISKAKFKVIENDGICYNSSVTGFVKIPEKLFTICTDNIKRSFHDVTFNVNRVVTHESMHVVQICNKFRPVGIYGYQLSGEKQQNLTRSINVGDNVNSDIEYEAYAMEDNPTEVIRYIKRFCF